MSYGGLGPNPFERKIPPEEERKAPPVAVAERPREAPEVEPPKEREIPDIPYTVKDPYTGKDIDLVLKQGMFLWREDKLEGFFTKDGTFITTRPEETEPWERTRAFFSNIWRGLPINPYYWKSPEAKWEADRKDALIAWAKEADIENPEEYVKDLMSRESKELAWEAYEPEEGVLRVPEYPLPPIGERVTVGERFVGEWVIPMAILSGLGLSAIKGRAALEAAAAKPGVVGALAYTGRVALAPVAGYEWLVGKIFHYAFGVPTKWVEAKVSNVWWNKKWEGALLSKVFPKGSPEQRDLFRIWKLYHTKPTTGQPADMYEIVARKAFEQSYRTNLAFKRGLDEWMAAVAGTAGVPKEAATAVPLLSSGIGATTTPDTGVALARIIDTAIKQKIPTITPAFIASQVKGLEKTASLIAQLKDLGYTAEAITAMKPEEAWANLFKAAEAPPAVPPEVPAVKPPVVKPEVTKPPAVEVVPPEPVIPPIEGIPEALATQAQKIEGHTIAQEKALIDPKTRKTTQQYRRLAQNITGKKSMKDMTSDEASAFIEALERYPDKKWSPKTGKWIPQPMPIIKAIVPENYFALTFGEPTPIRYFTSQNFYATKLGVGELTQPLEVAKQELDLVFPAWAKAIDLKIKGLNKAYKVTVAEKLIAFRNNLPTRASKEMALLLNKYEDLPANIVDKLGTEKVALFSWFRNLSRTILNGQNQVREILGMPPIPHREAYLRHIATEASKEIWRGNYSLPSDLAYWSRRVVGKRVFNPMEIPRQMTDDLLEYFSKDLGYLTKSMIHTGLKEIYLSQPLKAFTTQLNVLSKGMMPFSSLSPTELEKAQTVSVLPASTHKWVVDYVNTVIKGQQTELDASINRIITQSGIGGVFDTFLKEFGRSIGTRPITKMAQFSGRLIISATIGTKPRQIIRNLFQSTQNLALYGVEPTLSAFLPAGKTLTRLLNNSMFLKSYARYEELPTSAMGKAERAWMWTYGKSAIFNATTGEKAAFYGTLDYITNPKNKGLGWADPNRTYTEPKGFLYDSEREKLLREMEFGAGCTQYQYIGMGMPEVFRHKTLIPVTRLQSWWMNYFFKFNREAIHRFWTGSVGWDPNLKIPPSARLNWIKYVILGGAVLTALGYSRSFMKDVLPHWGSPAAQMMVGAYNYVIADTDYKREQAKRSMYYSMSAFAPGAIDYKSWTDVWTGEKPMSSLFFYGEDWPPDMPTWGIPPLVEEVEIKHAIEYVNEEVPKFREKLGTLIPAEDDIEEYTYEMSDFAVEIRALIRNIPPERVIEKEGFSDIVLMYKKAETLWDEHYYSLPASARQEWLQRDTPESIWTGAYLALWGKLKVTGWVSGNPQTIELIKKLVADFNIPSKAIPSLGELGEREKAKEPYRPAPMRKPEVPKPTTPTPSREGGLGPNPFE